MASQALVIQILQFGCAFCFVLRDVCTFLALPVITLFKINWLLRIIWKCTKKNLADREFRLDYPHSTQSNDTTEAFVLYWYRSEVKLSSRVTKKISCRVRVAILHFQVQSLKCPNWSNRVYSFNSSFIWLLKIQIPLEITRSKFKSHYLIFLQILLLSWEIVNLFQYLLPYWCSAGVRLTLPSSWTRRKYCTMPTSSQALTLLKQFTAISHSIQYPIEVPETVSSLVSDVCLQEFDEIKDSESILHDNPQQVEVQQVLTCLFTAVLILKTLALHNR